MLNIQKCIAGCISINCVFMARAGIIIAVFTIQFDYLHFMALFSNYYIAIAHYFR